MKKFLFLIVALMVAIGVNAQKDHRTFPFKKTVTVETPAYITTGMMNPGVYTGTTTPAIAKSGDAVIAIGSDDGYLSRSGETTYTSVDSTFYFGPSLSIDVFTKDLSTGEYTVGVMPGVGYGIKWNPLKWKDNYLIAIDGFAQAGVTSSSAGDKYFELRFIPTVSLLNWIHVGYGPSWKIGLDGAPDDSGGVLSIGITKSL